MANENGGIVPAQRIGLLKTEVRWNMERRQPSVFFHFIPDDKQPAFMTLDTHLTLALSRALSEDLGRLLESWPRPTDKVCLDRLYVVSAHPNSLMPAYQIRECGAGGRLIP